MFLKSNACEELLTFILSLQKSVIGVRISESELTAEIQPLMEWLETIDKWIDEVPPIEQPMRFGNKSFRVWVDRVRASADEMLFKVYPHEGFKLAIPELNHYFMDSFGSYERIDYGTGHELNFLLFLLCLFKLKVLSEDSL